MTDRLERTDHISRTKLGLLSVCNVMRSMRLRWIGQPQKTAGITNVAISKLKETLAEVGQGKHSRKWSTETSKIWVSTKI